MNTTWLHRLMASLLLLPGLFFPLACEREDPSRPIETIPLDGEPGKTPEEQDQDDEDVPDDDKTDWAAARSYVFDESVIPEVHLQISQSEWNRLLEAYDRDANTQLYIPADVRYVKAGEVTEIAGAGLRLKGNTSRRRPQDGNGRFHHCHFGLNFYKYTKDAAHSIHGMRKVDLKWFKDDPNYVREIYCYDLFRRYGVWTAIEDIYARVWIRVGSDSEKYLGVYGMMEHIDKNYLRIRKEQFGSKGGNLWKCRNMGSRADLRKTDAYLFGADDNEHSYTYELKTNTGNGFEEAKAQMRNFISQLNSLSGHDFNVWIASVMDVDLFLRTLAVNVAVGMWDDYWVNGNNYYLYFNSKDPAQYQVFVIPYDYDNTLGTSSLVSDSGRQDPYNWGASNCPLTVKILKNTSWRSLYRQYLQEICGSSGDFYYKTSIARIQQWQGRIRSFIANDTGEDNAIYDAPASWGNHGEYRLLDENAQVNWFRVKSQTVNAMK